MSHLNRETNTRSAAGMVASLFGILAGVGGLTHGVGEVLQGNVAPEGIFIPSWTRGPIATHMGGEPGLTIVPNMLLTGVLAILVSLATITWAAFFVRRKHGGYVLIGLATLMLLVGGGVGPPLIGILAGFAGTTIDRPLSGWRQRVPAVVRRLLVTLWPALFGVAALSGVFLVLGSLILVFFFDLNNAALFLNTFYVTVVSLLLTTLLAPFRDQRHRRQARMAAV
jgi:hypothetical protein